MKPSHIVLCALFASLSSVALAGLTGEVREDLVTAGYHSCLSSKPPTNTAEYLSNRPRLCRCAAERMADAFDIDTLKRFEAGQGSVDPKLFTEIREWCLQHYAEFDDKPPPSPLAKSKSTHDSVLFNGKTHRFTAFRVYVYSKDNQLVKAVELNNGQALFDFQVNLESAAASIVDVKRRQRSALVPMAGDPQAKGAQAGINYDWAFLMTGVADSYVFIDSKRNLMASRAVDDADGSVYVVQYVRSQVLMCDALREARVRAITSAATNIFKEVLVAAIRSYAGASYSGGTFTARTTSGQSVSGTYTRYDPSWLGEHYSRGLDAVFQGTASLADINRELTRLECGSQ